MKLIQKIASQNFVGEKKCSCSGMADKHLLLHAIVEEAPDPIYVKDLDGRYVLINPAGVRWLNKKTEEVIGKTDFDFFDQETAAIITAYDKEVISKGSLSYERTGFFAGNKKTYLSTKRVFADAYDKIIGIVGTSQDITEVKQAEAAKDNFIAMLSHELRNPMAPIVNALQIINLHNFTDPVLKNAIGIIDRQTRNMSRLLNDLLDASRVTRGKIELHKEVISLEAIVRNAIDAAKPFIDARNHNFKFVIPEENIFLNVDPVRIEQILTNLLNNATKFTERGGEISFIAETQGSDVVFKIQDNGRGLNSDVLDKIFNPFFQVDQSLARSERGLGVGLAIVKVLTEMHGGTVEVKSDGLAKGSEFIVKIPIENTVSLENSVLVLPNVSEKKRVLVVDDNVDAANSLGELMRRWGHEVHTANDGVAALTEMSNFIPDVILLDIGLPEIDGYQVAQQMRQKLQTPPPIIIAVTGYGQAEDQRKAKTAGFDHHFTKPIDFERLRQIINMVA